MRHPGVEINGIASAKRFNTIGKGDLDPSLENEKKFFASMT